MRARPASQQIDAAAAQLSCARPRQDEAPAPPLDQPVDFVEERRHTLNFIDDDGGRHARLGERLEPVGVGEQFCVHTEVEEVEPGRTGKRLAQQRGLAGAARAEQEEALAGRQLDGSGEPIAIIYPKTAAQMPGLRRPDPRDSFAACRRLADILRGSR